MGPVDILKQYLWRLSAMPLGPPQFLFTQFAGSVHPDGHWYMLADSAEGHALHPISDIQVVQELLELHHQPNLAHCGLTGPQFRLLSLKSDESSEDWRRIFISFSFLTEVGMKVLWSAEPLSPEMVPAEVITPNQFIKYEGLNELLIRADYTASEKHQTGLHVVDSSSKSSCHRVLAGEPSLT